jgi:hypothetical protein
MPQNAKIIDITRGYIPIDPETYLNNLHGTGKEDSPETPEPVVAYEGYNFLPTSYGYRSYFGTSRVLDIDALPSRCDKILLLHTQTRETKLVALCEDGIWTKYGEEVGAWVHEAVLAIPPEGTTEFWSYCVIENILYCYRAGETSYYKFAPEPIFYSQDERPDPLTSIEALPTSGYGTLPANTYTYSVSIIDELGLISDSVTITVTTTVDNAGSIFLNWDERPGFTYRLYRQVDEVVRYIDLDTNSYIDRDIDGTIITVFPESPQILKDHYFATAVTPNFLNMEGQQGIYKAGLRLGFWDSENSTSWSALDDFTDFTPSLETLAGSAIFGDIRGRIVTILPYKEGFIIYATKSIVQISQAVEATFQWIPTVLVNSGGIMYPRQAVAGIFPEQHFAYTSQGILKIPGEKSRVETVTSALYDHLKESASPIFLTLLENRYLVFEIIEEQYIDGRVSFSYEIVHPITYTFNTNPLPLEDYDLSGSDLQKINKQLGIISSGMSEEQQAEAALNAAASEAPEKKANSFYTPRWAAYFSGGPFMDVGDIEWTDIPCATVGPTGEDADMCPSTTMGQSGRYGKEANKKTQVNLSSSMEVMTTFLQVQLALWRMEDESREAYINAILSRTGNSSKTTEVSDPVSSYEESICNIGTYPIDPSIVSLGWTGCAVWIGRLFKKGIQIKRTKRDKVESNRLNSKFTSPTWGEGQTFTQATSGCFPENWWPTAPAISVSGMSPSQIQEDLLTKYNNRKAACGEPTESSVAGYGLSSILGSTNTATSTCSFNPSASGCMGVSLPGTAYTTAICPVGYSPRVIGSPAKCSAPYAGANQDFVCISDAAYEKVETMIATNTGTTSTIPLIFDSAWAEVVGWDYVDKDGNPQFLPKTEKTCYPPSDNEDLPESEGVAILGQLLEQELNPYMFGPYTPVTVPEISPNPIVWPSTSVTVPGGYFLLQEGSIGPIYPEFAGALFYDLAHKKWGKMKNPYYQLLDYTPVNALADMIIDYDEMQVRGGLLGLDGHVSLFDAFPANSYIKYGKIGYSRLGMTDAEEVRVSVRTASDFTIGLEGSLDGRTVEGGLVTSESFLNKTSGILNASLSARWYNICISGLYDLTHLEFRGHEAGRR